MLLANLAQAQPCVWVEEKVTLPAKSYKTPNVAPYQHTQRYYDEERGCREKYTGKAMMQDCLSRAYVRDHTLRREANGAPIVETVTRRKCIEMSSGTIDVSKEAMDDLTK